MHGDFFAIVVQLARLNHHVNTVLIHLLLNVGQVLRDLLIALFHWQLEVKNGLTTPAVDQPGGHQGRHFRWLLYHIAHHPGDVVAGWAVAETIFT